MMSRRAAEEASKADRSKTVEFHGQPEGKPAIKGGKSHAGPMQFTDRIGVEVVMNLTGRESYTQKVVLGLVILGAVLLDMLKHRGFAFLRRTGG